MYNDMENIKMSFLYKGALHNVRRNETIKYRD